MTISANIRVVSHLAHFFYPYRGRVVAAAVALVIASGTILGLGQGLRWMVDSGLSGGDPELLDRSLLVLLGVVILLAGATATRYYNVTWLGERIAADLRKAVFDRLLAMEPGFFEDQRTGELLSRMTADTTLLQSTISVSVSIALRNLLTFSGGIVLLAVTSPKLTALVSLCVPLVIGPILLYGRRVRKLSRTTQDRVGDMGAYVDETLHGIRTVQAFQHEEIDKRRFAERVYSAFSAARNRIRTRAQLTAIVILLVFGAIGVILWIGGHDMLQGRISAGQLSAFVFYSIIVAAAVGAISEVIGELQQAAGATERLLELLATQPGIVSPENPLSLPSPLHGEVRFQQVCFAYPSRPDHLALDHFDLTISPGETVALVGPSGAGKSTILNLLLRFNDPTKGTVLLDGCDLRRVDPAELRRHMAIVAQEPTLFADTILENIRYGRPDASDEEVLLAAQAAYADEFVRRLPRAYQTVLGERGARLSGGQKQRLAIARALLRDPVLLLLDEATSALDSESEQAVQKALTRLMEGRTTLVIAHRLATVINAGRIVVMDHGRIVAEGQHGELMRQGGLYRRLAELQFRSGAQRDTVVDFETRSTPVSNP